MRLLACSIVLALSACGAEPDPIASGWQRIADAGGPVSEPGVDRLWFTWAGHFTRELPAKIYSGTYEDDDFAGTLTLHATSTDWSGYMSGPACPAPWTSLPNCLLLYNGNTHDLYRPLRPVGKDLWF